MVRKPEGKKGVRSFRSFAVVVALSVLGLAVIGAVVALLAKILKIRPPSNRGTPRKCASLIGRACVPVCAIPARAASANCRIRRCDNEENGAG